MRSSSRMGPWSIPAAEWLRLPGVFGQLSPTLVYDIGTEVPADALHPRGEKPRSSDVTAIRSGH